MAHALTAQLLSRHSNFRSAAVMRRIDMPAHKLRAAIDYIEAHLNQELSIGLMAVAVGMSAFRFARGFKAGTGRSPHQYLIERRVELAKDLLRSTDHKLIDIATNCRLHQPESLCRGVQRCRMTPRGYREMTRLGR